MKQTYFIDSENVNELWINLLENAPEDAELLVFYTKGTPHMSYSGIRRLYESRRPITFIKCYDGTNALDFQLVTELGYRLAGLTEPDAELIIVSNDNGFEAAVNYWKDRGFPVRRINGQVCGSITSQAAPAQTMTQPKSKPQPGVTAEATEEDVEQNPIIPRNFPQEELDSIIRCLGKKKLAELYNALIAIYGESGKEYYAIIKQKSYKVEPQAWNLNEKFDRYIAIVFANSEVESVPENLSEFLFSVREKLKNLNSLRAALTKEFGKETGSVLYTHIKPHTKWLEMMN